MTWHSIRYTLAGLFLVMAASRAACALDSPQRMSISLGTEFASGTYGTDSTTRTIYTPLIATWMPNDRLDIGIEIPFTYQSSSNVTTSLYHTGGNATVVKTTLRGGPGGPGGTSGSGAQQQSGSGSHPSASAVSGLGDIILRLGVSVLSEDAGIPHIRPSLFVKCPTAEVSDGLGTGEFDFGVGVEISKWFGDLLLAGEGFHTWQGPVDGFGLTNYFSYTAGVGYHLTENIRPVISVKGATAPSSYSGNLLEARARVIWSLTDTTSLDLFGSRGIADSSPEYGGGIAVIYSF